MVGIVPQDFPCEGIRLAARESRHDGTNLPRHDVRFPVVCRCCPIDAVGTVRLNDGDDGTLRPIVRGKVSRNRARQRPDARLQEDMRRHLSVLLHRLMGKRRVALHDPLRPLRVAVERRVLHEQPALFLRHLRCIAHGIIIVVGGKRCLCTESANVRQTLRGAALRHKDTGKQPKELCRPRHTAPVVAVRCRDEGDAAQPLTVLRCAQALIGHLLRGDAKILRETARDGIARAEPLERIQPEPLALILHGDPRQPERLCELPEVGERRRLVRRQCPMKRLHTRRCLCTVGREICLRRCIMREMCRLD